MLNIILSILTLLIFIHHTRQTEFKVDKCSSKDCGKPFIALTGEVDAIKNVFLQNKNKKPLKYKINGTTIEYVPILVKFNKNDGDIFRNIKKILINQNSVNKNRYKKLRHRPPRVKPHGKHFYDDRIDDFLLLPEFVRLSRSEEYSY